MIKNGLFIFHRDFRIIDNKGLINASKSCDKLYTCFVFTPEQVSRNSYKSKNSIQFMIESLNDLQEEIASNNGELIIIYENTLSALSKLIETLNINGLFFNEDYTPYAKARTEEVKQLCDKKNIICETSQDYYINKPGSVLNGKGVMYVRFTPFYESYFFDHSFESPNIYNVKNLSKTTKKIENRLILMEAMNNFVGKTNDNIAVNGGRTNGLLIFQTALRNLNDYKDTRDTMSEKTTMLSAYIKYGCLSIREIVTKIRITYSIHHELIRQLIWRDFYMHLLSENPESLEGLTNSRMRKIRWSSNKDRLEKWKTGKTGFPIVDAGMRQMNETGYMHNRVRMIVATFLSKILYLDWRDGEKYFAQKLVDYDVASNTGNWQAVVGGGLYAMPWFHILSPWTQSKKNDNDLEYIRKWVPELEDVPDKHIHKWYKYYKQNTDIDYLKPCVDFDKRQDEYIIKMKDILS
jgi:deoxyribodipyrimidine photo-lyase